ncbi:MAG: DNA polymerase III subunit delta' [Gammaproteobacteria bacterium]|nr:DNA polymerase III subunit delta' [Gammaproteobacteria bacterium]MDH5594301.1 DNA polymerase III subunit delta' [Gammaproteobacteria bacterium]
MSHYLPWQSSQWQQLSEQLQANRLPHALMLTGIKGIGKLHFAKAFAETTLCTNRQIDGCACGQCRSCLLVAAGSHPDLVTLMPEDDSKVIKIDQIRDFIDTMTLTSQYGGYKVVIIYPADTLNRNAANSLLKTLEEPPGQSLIVLVTDRPSHLPATIRSRCHQLAFHAPIHSEALSWLKNQPESIAQAETLLALASGGPLEALKLAENDVLSIRDSHFTGFREIADGIHEPAKLASDWLKNGIKQPLYWLSTWIMDIIRLKVVQNPPQLNNPDLRTNLQHFAEGLNLTGLYAFQEKITDTLKLADTQCNAQMLLEGLLIEWKRLQKN